LINLLPAFLRHLSKYSHTFWLTYTHSILVS
jgi:hypothetical protein